METTLSLAKEQGLAALTLVAVIVLGVSTNGQFAALRAEMAAGHQTIRAEINEEFKAVRADMSDEFKAVRADMSDEFKAVRADMGEEFKAVRSEIAGANERLARVETRLDSIENRLYMDTALIPM